MFGYTVPLYSRMSAADLSAYRRYYCETCHQLKAGYGLMSTATVNYDMTFNTVVLNAVAGEQQEIAPTRHTPFCVLGAPRADSVLLRQMAGYTVLLTKWELYDDRVDKPSLKTDFIGVALGRAIAQAEQDYPYFDKTVENGFLALHDLELAGCTDALKMGTEFGQALAAPLGRIAGPADSPALRRLFAALTAAVYVMDAFDDLESDYRDGTYNPFLRDCPRFANRAAYMTDHLYDATATAHMALHALQTAYQEVRPQMRSGRGIADNIVFYGLPDATKKAIEGRSEAKLSVKNALLGSRNRNANH